MSNASILVVDDDVEVCRILDRMLSGAYQVKMVPSVADAVAAIEQSPFDLYVVDFNLADGTGLDVADRIRSKGSEAPIILLSGCDPTTLALGAAKLGIAEIIQKPFSRVAIFSALKQALGAPRVALA
jgi:DNA-binding NtrC family response regulator